MNAANRMSAAALAAAAVVLIVIAALAALALLEAETVHGAANDADPWSQASGWRMNGDYRRTLSFTDEYGDYRIGLTYRNSGWEIDLDKQRQRIKLVSQNDAELALRLGETALHGCVRRDGDAFHVFTGGRHHTLTYNDPMAHAGEIESAGGRLTAPMPGKVVSFAVQAGDTVSRGQPLAVMEAMKMEHTIAAPADGVVEELLYAPGDQVTEGSELLRLSAA